MIRSVEVTSSPIGQYVVKIEGYGRTSYTLCQSEGQAHELAYIARVNVVVAEKLHGLND